MPGWPTDEDVDTLAALSAGTFGLTVKPLAAPGTSPLAVLGEAHVIDRFRSGSGGLCLTPAWPAGQHGTAAAAGARGEPVRHGVSWCQEHGDAVEPCWSGTPKAGSAAPTSESPQAACTPLPHPDVAELVAARPRFRTRRDGPAEAAG